MTESKVSHRKSEFVWSVFPTAIAMVLSFSLTEGGSSASDIGQPDNSVSILDRAAPAVRKQILTAATQVFERSLEMKENVDFLLTPALLVQEAISEDIVVTYPSE